MCCFFKAIFQRITLEGQNIICTAFKITLEGREEGGRERPEGEVRDVGLKINII